MATDFPANPSNGDTHAGFTYNSTTGAWESSGSGGSGVTSHANVAAFPASPSEGDLAYAQDTDALYLRRGSGWERIDNGGESPVITTEPPTSTQALSNSGSTSTVTMVAQDPEGFDVTYGIAYKTTGNARPTQLSADTTINQNTGVYTFTPSTNSAHAGSFRARLSASDGANTTTRLVDFSLAFAATVDYLVVAGGGAGGGTTNGAGEGGGGAGGLIYATGQTFAAGVTFGITVGAGGTAGTGQGGDGGNSVISGTGFTTVTAIGGGGNGSGGNGTANTGGGGGGATNENTAVGSGGSGVVILRTTSTASATTGSPTVTQDGSYNVYKFTADGSITF